MRTKVEELVLWVILAWALVFLGWVVGELLGGSYQWVY